MPGDSGPHVFFVELKEHLAARTSGNLGSKADSKLLIWKGTTYQPVAPEVNFDVWNYTTNEFEEGDRPHIIWHNDSKRWLVLGGGGNACDRITFTIYSTNCPTAVVNITSRPCGCKKVPEEVLGQVTVHDVLGCLELTVGARGKAEYMSPDPLTGKSCRWEIYALCCPGVEGCTPPSPAPPPPVPLISRIYNEFEEGA